MKGTGLGGTRFGICREIRGRDETGWIGSRGSAEYSGQGSGDTGQHSRHLPAISAGGVVQRAQGCKKSGVPEEIRFQTKPEMALGQIPSLVKEDVPRGVVLADAAYGNDNGFREGLEALGISARESLQRPVFCGCNGL